MKIKPKYTCDKDEIISSFSEYKGVYYKISKNCPELRPILDKLIDILVLVSQLKLSPAIGIHYNSKRCFCIKREYWDLAELYGYKELLNQLGITYEGTCPSIGFSGFHNSSNKISATFREAIIAHLINCNNGVDEKYSLRLTIEYSKKSASYSMFMSELFQNGSLYESYKVIAKKAAPLFKGMILAKYKGKAILTILWMNNKNNSYKLGYRKTTYVEGAVKTDLVDIVSGIGISLKESYNSQLCSQSPEETLTTLMYIQGNTTDLKLKERIDYLILLYGYDNICCKVFNEQVSIIKKKGNHPYHNLVMSYEDTHKIITAEIIKTCIDFPEFKYKLVRDSILGESKFQIGCNAIPKLMFHFNADEPNNYELCQADEFIANHINDISINVTWKATTPRAFAYTSLRLYFHAKKKAS